ncbi:type IV toxin-antitoxin system AbiEi family antitoxin domain-containing protein [Thalassiella azotivora]
MPADPELPAVFTRAQALTLGMTSAQVSRRVAAGRWRQLRRGVYCTEAAWRAAGHRSRRELAVRAAVSALSGPLWVSHASAALLHGLPVPGREPGVFLTRQPPGSARYLDGVTVEVATVPAGDRRTAHGLPVTSVRRTVADCLRHCSPRDGLAVLDAALARSPDLREDVGRVLADCEIWPYSARAHRVVRLGDGRRESPLESWSAWEMDVHGVPAPEPQFVVRDAWGDFVARVDFWWDDVAVAGEADGLVKYDVSRGTGEVQRALVEEKRREDRLRALGIEVVRWGAADLARPERWAADLRHRLARRSPQRRIG